MLTIIFSLFQILKKLFD